MVCMVWMGCSMVCLCLYGLYGLDGLDLLTLEVLPGARQQLVEHVEGPLVFGLSDGSGLLQKV